MWSLMLGFHVEFTTPMVGRIGIVIGHAFPAQVVIGALDFSGDHLCSRLVNRVLERFAGVIPRQRGQ